MSEILDELKAYVYDGADQSDAVRLLFYELDQVNFMREFDITIGEATNHAYLRIDDTLQNVAKLFGIPETTLQTLVTADITVEVTHLVKDGDGIAVPYAVFHIRWRPMFEDA